VFTVVAGVLLFGSTQKLISAADWVQHTQDVLSSLQRASLLAERVEYRTHLYQLTKDEDQLDRARQSAHLFETNTVRLTTLVEDNPYQMGNVRNLTSCGSELSHLVEKLTPESPLPEVQVQRCQQTISLMTDHEQSLLKQRTISSQRSSFASIGTDLAFAGLSLLGLVTLFGFLVRDALLRQRVAAQTGLTNERLAQTVDSLEDQAQESELLTAARNELQLCVDVEQVYKSAANSFSRLLAGTSGSLCMINNSRLLVEVVSSWQEGAAKSAIEDFHPPESCCGLRSGQARWRQPGVSEIQCTHFSGEPPERYLCKPIVSHGNAIGVLYIQCPDERAVSLVKQRMNGLLQLNQLTGMAVAALNLRTKLENQSIRDPLTELFNRHFMQISLDRELSRAARHSQSLCVLMLDVDHFKTFNDTYGHAAGDTVLKAISGIFRASIRSEDVACRYGGEEFTIILPDVTQVSACERAEAIRLAVATLRVPLEPEVCGEFSVSIGVACYPHDGETADQLLRKADLALYRAKHQGRNQVVLFEGDPVTPVSHR
jgi:diguanylate cyclase (GGDEF)-like protein